MTTPKNPAAVAVKEYLASIGSTGGKTTGPTKARTTEQARAAGILGAQKRWANHRKTK